MSSSGDPRYVRVTCPTCRAVLHPRVEKAGRRVRCPDCYSAVLVPQPAETLSPSARREPGQYKVRDAAGPPQPQDNRSDDYFLTLCPVCQARLHPRHSQVGKKTRCPDCDTVFAIPPPPVATKPAPPPAPKPYPMGETVERPQVELELLTVQGRLEPEPPPPPPPRWWFASGVFTFPFQPNPLQRWISLALLLLPLEFVIGVIVYVALMSMSYVTTVVPFLAVPLAWLTFWAGSYAAACFMAIVQDTGSGTDEVHSWPEGDWRDRTAPLAYLCLQFIFAGAAASAVATAVSFATGPLWAGLAGAASATFFVPFCLLSAMEADTPLFPYSPVMLRSLRHSCGAWLIAYAESFALVGAITGLLVIAAIWAPILAIILASPLLASLVFVMARLYGRLAWRIGEHETGRRKKRVKKKAAPAVA